MRTFLLCLTILASIPVFSGETKLIDDMPLNEIRELLKHLNHKLIYEEYDINSTLFPEGVSSHSSDTFGEIYNLPKVRLEKYAGDFMRYPEIGSLLCWSRDIELYTAKCIISSNNDYPEYHANRHRVQGNHQYSLRTVEITHNGHILGEVNPAYAFCKAIASNGNNNGVSGLKEVHEYSLKTYVFNYKEQAYKCPFERIYRGH